ncbi:MAG: TetR/AcrR family transcriptional regulator [Epsilonproteobacteria bacterium]|nr:TetR/AcrR family transcriptional regulator [Campylobacterota bacterium]
MKENKKEKILKIAAKYFAKHGFDSTSLDHIAKEAKITKAAIYYHFKDKASLYEEVLNKRLKILNIFLQEELKNKKDPKERLKTYIITFGEFLNENGCFAAILAHEFADNGKNMPKSSVKLLSNTLGTVTSILNEGIKQKEFKMENPMAIQLMIVSTLIMHQTTKDLRAKVSSLVEGFEILPEPNIKDLSIILAKKILKSIEKEK